MYYLGIGIRKRDSFIAVPNNDGDVVKRTPVPGGASVEVAFSCPAGVAEVAQF